MENGKNTQSLLIGNDPMYLNHFRDIFKELWKNAIKATDRIKDIEEGRETDDELADAKYYLNEVLEEISNMKNNTNQQLYYTSQSESLRLTMRKSQYEIIGI
jgi:hypothetical protein